MPTPTYDLIASNVLTSSVASISFSSISASYRDLILVGEIPANVNQPTIRVRFNSDAGSNYPQVYMRGDGSTASSSSSTGTDIGISEGANTVRSSGILHIMDYSATDKHKTCLARYGNSVEGVQARAARWANTAAIDTITIRLDVGNLESGSSFYLYGIAS